MFLYLSVILLTGGGHAWLLQGGVVGWGAYMVAPGGHVWLLPEWGGMCGCLGGMRGCSGGGGHAWLLPEGACMVALGGGACVVAPRVRGMCGCLGGHPWLLWGWGACLVASGGVWDMMRYGDTINERAVRILLECILVSNHSTRISRQK